MKGVDKLDRVLITLVSGFSIVLAAVVVSFVFPQISTLSQNTEENVDTLSHEFIDISVDYDLIKYQEFVDELATIYQDKEVAITLRHLSDDKYDFSINGDYVMGAASTYKLFTAYSMYESAQAPSCLEDMIVYSDNVCPENWGRWNKVTEDAHKIGATSTRINTAPTLTTSNDLALFLTKLYDGSLLPDTETSHLVSLMKQQIFREGIPSGIPGVEVADKVGFLNGALNDAGIVYSEKGDFVLVILTDGYSWQVIANIASEIYAMM